MGQNLAPSMLKGAPAWKKYTTCGRGGLDWYELRSFQLLFINSYTLCEKEKKKLWHNIISFAAIYEKNWPKNGHFCP